MQVSQRLVLQACLERLQSNLLNLLRLLDGAKLGTAPLERLLYSQFCTLVLVELTSSFIELRLCVSHWKCSLILGLEFYFIPSGNSGFESCLDFVDDFDR